MNVVHGAGQSDLTLVDHVSQNRAALANAIDGQHNVFIGYGLDKFIILRRSVGFKPGNGRHRRFILLVRVIGYIGHGNASYSSGLQG